MSSRRRGIRAPSHRTIRCRSLGRGPNGSPPLSHPPLDLIEQAGQAPLAATGGSRDRQTLAAGDLADVFGIELSQDVATVVQEQPSPGRASRPKKLSPEKPAARARGKETQNDRAKREPAPKRKSKSVMKKK